MNAPRLAFRGEFSAPTWSADLTPFAAITPMIDELRRRLSHEQLADGSWCEWRGDDLLATADLLLLLDFTHRDHDPRRTPLTRALLAGQQSTGSWGNLTLTIRAYLALAGELSHDAEPMQRARDWLAGWGAIAPDPATRLRLALFGQLPHADEALPTTSSPAEALAWSILASKRPVCSRPRDALLAHLMRDELRWPGIGDWNLARRWSARRVGNQLMQLLMERDPSDVSGSISVLPLMALHALGEAADSPAVMAGWRWLDERIIMEQGHAHVTGSLTPMMDTARVLLALHEAGTAPVCAAEWLWSRLVRGHARESLTLDEAALSLIALTRSGFVQREDRPVLSEHVLNSLLDSQEDSGGWGTPERTGMMLEALGLFGLNQSEEVVADAVGYLEAAQEADSGWGGAEPLRATWQILMGLRAVGCDARSMPIRRAAGWLTRTQQIGGAWGDSPESFARSTAYGVLALLTAGDGHDPAVDAGIDRLLTFEPTTNVTDLAAMLSALSAFKRGHSTFPVSTALG